MPGVDFLPRRLDKAFSRLAFPEAAKALLALHGNPEYCAWWDDFFGDALDARYAATVGTGTEVIGVAAAGANAVGGAMSLATDASGTGTAGQGLSMNWNGDLGVYFIARLKLVTITDAKFEIGLTDAVDDDGAVNVKATPTFTATDCALFVFDTTDDTNVTFVSNGGTTDGNADASNFTLVADTYFIVEIVVQGNAASGYINGGYVGGGNIEGGNNIGPWAYVEELSASARTLIVDYWGVLGPRT